MSKLSSYLSTILLIFIILQFTPGVFKVLKDEYEDAFGLRTKVGLLKINGEITSPTYYQKYLRAFFEANDIKAILLEIESPGGSAGSSQAIFNEIISLKKEHPKPVITLSNDLCASGGYYIACASDYIIASPMAVIGSIGSYIGSFKIKDLMEKYNVKFNYAKSGEYKTTLNPYTEDTKEMNKFLQTVSDDVYNTFKHDVAIRRKLSLKNEAQWANGKFFTGKQAQALGLIDELGSQYNAIKKVRELALIEKEKRIDWVKPPRQSTMSQLFGIENDEASVNVSFTDKIVDKVCQKLGFEAHPKTMLE